MRCDKSDRSIINLSPWNWQLRPGEKLAIISTNSYLKYQLIATLANLVKPVSGNFLSYGSIGWPFGGEDGLDNKLTLKQGLEFLTSIYSDCLESSLISIDELLSILLFKSIKLESKIKELQKEEKKFFFLSLSLLFSFDIYLIPNTQYLMSEHANLLRPLFSKQLKDKALITTSIDSNFRHKYCNKGMIISSLGEIVFEGNLKEAIKLDNLTMPSFNDNQLEFSNNFKNLELNDCNRGEF
ncbi:hypothetical protein CREGCYN_14460 [Synechococcus sp. M16CYN]